jgi:hypothetical protein
MSVESTDLITPTDITDQSTDNSAPTGDDNYIGDADLMIDDEQSIEDPEKAASPPTDADAAWHEISNDASIGEAGIGQAQNNEELEPDFDDLSEPTDAVDPQHPSDDVAIDDDAELGDADLMIDDEQPLEDLLDEAQNGNDQSLTSQPSTEDSMASQSDGDTSHDTRDTESPTTADTSLPNNDEHGNTDQMLDEEQALDDSTNSATNLTAADDTAKREPINKIPVDETVSEETGEIQETPLKATDTKEPASTSDAAEAGDCTITDPDEGNNFDEKQSDHAVEERPRDADGTGENAATKNDRNYGTAQTLEGASQRTNEPRRVQAEYELNKRNYVVISNPEIDGDGTIETYDAPYRPAGAGGGWKTINERQGGAVPQLTEHSCGSACAEMISNGEVSQSDILKLAGDKAWSPYIAEKMNELSKHFWRGGAVDESDFDKLNARAPWSAELYEGGRESHVVVIDGLDEQGRIKVRDPWAGGSSYLMDRQEFMRVWNGIVLFRQ